MADKWLAAAEAIDALRVVPRAIVSGYGFIVWESLQWFWYLPDPNTQQAAVLSAVIGAAGAATKFYVETGREWRCSDG